MAGVIAYAREVMRLAAETCAQARRLPEEARAARVAVAYTRRLRLKANRGSEKERTV